MANSAGEGTSDNGDDHLSLDAILDLLTHHHRRAMLQALISERENRVPENEIIPRLEEQEQQRTGEIPTPGHIEQVLHHMHAPKFSEIGIVTYDESEEVYEYHLDERLEKWFDLIESEHEEEF